MMTILETKPSLKSGLEDEITVYVVDDDPAVCNSLRWLIESVGYEVETFNSARTFLDSFDPCGRGCVVLDVRMPGLNGLDLHEQLIEDGVSMPVIFITGHGDVRMAVEAMKNGAVDFIEKPFRDQHLLDCLQDAIQAHRDSYDEQEERLETARRLRELTKREHEVLDLLVEGYTNAQIAERFELSVKTVEAHRSNIRRKTDCTTAADLVNLVHKAKRFGLHTAKHPRFSRKS